METQFPIESSGGDGVPLLPARMVNEFAYCPRLAYFEWVDGVFADNADTVESRGKSLPVKAEKLMLGSHTVQGLLL